MKFSLRKTHTILTALAAVAILLAAIVFFVNQIDWLFRFDIFPEKWERILEAAAWAIGILGLSTGIVSAVISLYRISERH